LAALIRLVCHQALAQPLFGERLDFRLGFHQFYTAGLAASACVHLGFDDPHITADLVCSRSCILRCVHCKPLGHRQPVFGKQLLTLILMKIHVLSCCLILTVND
jgi:hypothetical protein